MGIYANTYVGPYATAKFAFKESKKTTTTQKKLCTNKECDGSISKKANFLAGAKFCPKCGSPVVDTPVTTTKKQKQQTVDRHDLTNVKDLTNPAGDYFYQMMIDMSSDIWIPNLYPNDTVPRPNMDFSPRDTNVLLEIKPAGILAEIDWFEKSFAADLNVIRKAYGPENVEVKWGVINTLS